MALPSSPFAGRYTARNWTQWTQGFQYGNALLCFELTGDQDLLTAARRHVVADMAEHLTHVGVHDHGFNNISTYGNLRRLMLEGRIPTNEWELNFYELALKVSGAVQAARWTSLKDGLGYIYSFNGSHSLFIDTIRTLRICCVAHTAGARAAGGTGRAHQPARPGADPRKDLGPVQPLLRRGTRSVRCAGAVRPNRA